MTAATLLADLFRQGALVTVVTDRVRVEAPKGVLTPEIRAALAAHKTRLLCLLTFAGEYRDALLAASDAADSLDTQARLIDELGPALATVVRDAVMVNDLA
jgi:TubC N-terminal docking domain